ncbi:hypothetical protein NFI96_031862, partial [Prochilodus magdalenae]
MLIEKDVSVMKACTRPINSVLGAADCGVQYTVKRNNVPPGPRAGVVELSPVKMTGEPQSQDRQEVSRHQHLPDYTHFCWTRMTRPSPVWRGLLGMLLLLYVPQVDCTKESVPRVKLSYKELLHSGSVVPFVGSSDGMQFETFLLDEERSRLLLGAKDHIYLLDPDNINKNPRKLSWPAPKDRVDMCVL